VAASGLANEKLAQDLGMKILEALRRRSVAPDHGQRECHHRLRDGAAACDRRRRAPQGSRPRDVPGKQEGKDRLVRA
jgi:hypothetical protein